MNFDMRKYIFGLFLPLLLLGAGCDNKDEEIRVQKEKVDLQQKQIEDLSKKIEKMSGGEEAAQIVGIDKIARNKFTQSTVNIVPEKINPVESKFSNTSNQKKVDELKISNIQAIPTVNSINFKWTTNIPSTGFVTIWPITNELGNTKGYSNVENIFHEASTYYRLVSGKEYSYSITAQSKDGSIATSEEKKFTTPIDVNPPIITITPVEMSGSAIFYVMSNEYAVVNVYWYRVDDRQIKKATYILDEPNKNYKISMQDDGNGYVSGRSVFSLKIDSVDDDNNFSSSGWNKYLIGVDLPIK